MAKKFIINDDDLIIGNVEFHKELLCKTRERNKTVGGGKWNFDREKNIIYFWGKSTDFGQVTRKQFEDSFKQTSVEQASLVFSHKMNFLEVLKEIKENYNKSK